MVLISFWIDVTGATTEAWNHWAAVTDVNTSVAPFGSPGEDAFEGGDRAYRWIQLLRVLANSEGWKPNADWFVFLPADAYAHVAALRSRLQCFEANEPLVFGRLAGRLDPKIPSFAWRQVPVPILSAGLILSWGVLALDVVRRLGDTICPDKEIAFFTSKSLIEIGNESASMDQVGFTASDYAVAFCLALANLPRPLSNFASYLDHYVLGQEVSARLALRAAFSRPWMRSNRTSFPRPWPAILENSPPCVLFAWPVAWPEAHRWADMLWRKGCQPGHLKPYVVHNNVQSGNSMFLVHEIEYSWWADGGRRTSAYYPPAVDLALRSCGSKPKFRDSRSDLAFSELLPALPLKLRQRRIRNEVFLLLGLPGGGTSWVLHALEQALGPIGAKGVTDLFQPFCHEAWRPEMATVLGAPEDNSFANIWRPPTTDEPLAALAEWVLAGAKVSVSKEIINVGRVKQFNRLGIHAFGLYRDRRHFFPVGDESFGTQEFCRTCFWQRMFRSFRNHQLRHIGLAAIQPTVLDLGETELEREVLLHTVIWYFLKSEGLPILRFEVLITGSFDEVAAEFLHIFGPTLKQKHAGADTFEMARIFANCILDTRRPPEFFDGRRAAYEELGIEAKIKLLFAAFRNADPRVDLSWLQ